MQLTTGSDFPFDSKYNNQKENRSLPATKKEIKLKVQPKELSLNKH